MDDFDRVRKNTSDKSNAKINEKIITAINSSIHLTPSELTAKIDKLEKEWDIERILEMNASTLAFIGVLLGAIVNPYWLILPGLVLIFLFQHAVQGWCPPVPIFRALNVRTRREIDWEKFSLKILRGDFANLSSEKNAENILFLVRK